MLVCPLIVIINIASVPCGYFGGQVFVCQYGKTTFKRDSSFQYYIIYVFTGGIVVCEIIWIPPQSAAGDYTKHVHMFVYI